MKLPAYGHELLAARKMGMRPAQAVIVTDSWDLARVYREADIYALVCDPPTAPYDFSMLYDLDVMLMVGSDDVLGIAERVALALPQRFSVSLRHEVLQVLVSLRQRFEAAGNARASSIQRAARQLAAHETLA